MTKSQAAALIAAAIKAAHSAKSQPLSLHRTAPDAARIALAKAECTQEAFEARYVAKIRSLNATGRHNLNETKCYAKERVVRKNLDWSEYNRPERAAEKFDLLAVCQFLRGDDGQHVFTSEDDMTALCGYDYFVARALEHRLRNAGLAASSGRGVVDLGSTRGLIFSDSNLHLVMTKGTGKTAHDILDDIEEEEAASLAQQPAFSRDVCDTVLY